MLILLLLGTLLILWGALKLRMYLNAKKWDKTHGILIEVSEGEFKELNLYSTPTVFTYPKAKYKYSVGNEEYFNNAVTFEKRNCFKYKDGNNEFWNNWKEGENIDVFYNPSNPAESILIPYMSKNRRSHYLAIIISGLLLITVGIITNSA